MLSVFKNSRLLSQPEAFSKGSNPLGQILAYVAQDEHSSNLAEVAKFYKGPCTVEYSVVYCAGIREMCIRDR